MEVIWRRLLIDEKLQKVNLAKKTQVKSKALACLSINKLISIAAIGKMCLVWNRTLNPIFELSQE